MTSFDYGPYKDNSRRVPAKIFIFQRKLYLKAKQEPKFRFYSLYGHVHRMLVLEAALKLVTRKRGGPGVDGVNLRDVNADEETRKCFLENLQQELQEKRYRPQPVKRIYIPKANGKLRPLGIPTVKDRVAQMAVLLVIEPIFEADFLDTSFGYRPGRSAHDAVKRIKEHLDNGLTEVYDADLSSCFDTIPHDKLIKSLERRISDRHILALIRKFLKCLIKDKDSKGRPIRPTKGTPQGGVLSPFLANIYLDWFDKGFYTSGGPGTWASAQIVRYADDFVILAKYVGKRISSWAEALIEERMGLEINQEKTSIISLRKPGNSVDFLGFTLRRVPCQYRVGEQFTCITPSVKAVQRGKRVMLDYISKEGHKHSAKSLVDHLTPKLKGWRNYYKLGYYRKAMRDMNFTVLTGLKRNFGKRSQRPLKRPKGQSWYHFIHTTLGLVRL